MKKRIAALAAACMLCLTVAARTAMAEETVGLGVETTSGTAGSTVSVVVALDDCAGVDSLQFRLNYDPAALELLEAEAGALLSGGVAVINTDEEGLIRVAYASAYGLTESGIAVQLSFTPLSDAGGAVTLSEALATRVDEQFTQTKAYLRITDGGVKGASGTLPAPVVTPWAAETPLPTATPVPSDAPEATEPPAGLETDEPQTPAAVPFYRNPTVLIAAGAALLLLAVGLVAAAKRSGKKQK